jgi:hypothetical protein
MHMKLSQTFRSIFQFVLVFTVVSGFVLLEACDKKESQGKKDVVRGQLTSGMWKIVSLTVDGTDRTSLFATLTLTFSSSSYTTTNGDPVWPASGTWSFADDGGSVLDISDIGEVHIESISETELILSFMRASNTFGPGRASSVKGNHKFHFAR